jgi:serine phosphatase RsbU (regulator of sigma subunit)/ABC-type amino acid transport substrate-binding protein
MNLKSVMILILLLFLGNVIFAEEARLTQLELSVEEVSWLKAHQTLRVGVGIAWPPFQYLENDEFKGMASDYIDMVAKRLGIRMEIVKNVSSFQEVLEMAKKREIDVLGCATETLDRKEYMDFTKPYFSSPIVIITAKDAAFIGGFADLSHKKVAFVKDLADYSRVKDKYPLIVPYMVNTPAEKLEAVSFGNADACMENLAVTSYLIHKYNLENLKIAAKSGLPGTNLAFGSRNDWPLLCSILNKAIASITKEEHDAIYKKWLPVRFEYKANWSEILKWLILIGTVFFLILGISLFWNRKLSAEISVRIQTEKALQAAKETAEAANRKIMESINYAKMIQSSLLANIDVVKSYIPNSFFIWEPRDIVGGDIFFTEKLEDGFIIAVADCTGHGVPGAFMTMIAVSALKRIVKDEGCHDPAEILKHLNVIVKTTLQQDTAYAVSDDGMDAGIARIQFPALTFSGAKIPLYYVHNGELTVIKGDRQSIGYRRSDVNFDYTNQTVHIEEGMSFYMATDGFADQIGGDERKFGTARLKKLLKEIHGKPFEEQRQILVQAFEDHRGENERQDDMTVVGFGLKN